MTALLQVQYDCTGSHLPGLVIPPGVTVAGYTTGSAGVPWTPSQFAAHPRAVRIDQSPVNTSLDERADVLDVETGAATLADIPGWYRNAWANYHMAIRPGQRLPAIYASASRITSIANALVAAGITSGPRLWVAHFGLPVADAIGMLVHAGGPYPVIGVQVHDAGTYDVSLMSAAWLNDVSRHPVTVQTLHATATLPAWRTLTSDDGGRTWH